MSDDSKRSDLFSVVMGANGEIAVDLAHRNLNPLIQVSSTPHASNKALHANDE